MPSIKLLSAGAIQKMATDFAADFERQTGNKIELNFATAGVVRDRIAGGEAADIVISSQSAIGELQKSGKLADDSVANLAETATGLFNRAGEPKPDISTPDKFKVRPAAKNIRLFRSGGWRHRRQIVRRRAQPARS